MFLWENHVWWPPRGVRYAKFLSTQYLINIDILQNCRYIGLSIYLINISNSPMATCGIPGDEEFSNSIAPSLKPSLWLPYVWSLDKQNFSKKHVDSNDEYARNKEYRKIFLCYICHLLTKYIVILCLHFWQWWRPCVASFPMILKKSENQNCRAR